MIDVTRIQGGMPLRYGSYRELVHVDGRFPYRYVTPSGLVRIRRESQGRVIYGAVRPEKLFQS